MHAQPGVGEKDAHPLGSSQLRRQFEACLEVGDGVRGQVDLEGIDQPHERCLVLYGRVSSPFEIGDSLPQPFKQERTSPSRRIDHSDHRVRRCQSRRDRNTSGSRVIGPGGAIGNASRQTKIGPDDVIDTPDNAPNHRDRRVVSAEFSSLLGVVTLQKLLIEKDDRVILSIVNAEVGEHLIDVNAPQQLSQIVQAELVSIEGLVALISEARVQGIEERVPNVSTALTVAE